MELILTLYILVWPVISAAVLFVICRAFLRDLREARKEARDLV